jgi:putative transposase
VEFKLLVTLLRYVAAGRHHYLGKMMKAPIPFREFDERGQVRIYQSGILPHWRQAGCTYFVTFRLADSIPRRVLAEIEYERTQWLQARSIDATDETWQQSFARLPTDDKRQYERLVAKLLNHSLDLCHGECVLRNPMIAERVAAALDYFHGSRVLTGDFVIMPNHVHVLLTPLPDFELEDVLQSIKSFTAKVANELLNRTGLFWQRDSYDHVVRDNDQLQAFREYIVANPVKANLPAGDYLVSKAEYCFS